MNWNGLRRGSSAALVSAALALGTTSCSRDFTVAYVYATASTTTTTGLVDGYLVDYQSGALTQLANSPTPSGGRNPVSLVATPSGKYIYVIHRDDSSVVEFGVGTDGKLYPQHTYNTLGSYPLAAAVDSTGAFLYVVSTYQPGYTDSAKGPGNITVFPISDTDGSLGTPTSIATGFNPIGITVGPYPSNTASGTTPTHFIYVADRETVTTASGATAAKGYIQTFSQASNSPSLTRVTTNETVSQGVPAGVQPGGIIIDPTGRYLYVSDSLSNQINGYLIVGPNAPIVMTNAPFATASFPLGVTIEPRGKYLYVANFNDSSITAYTIDQTTGNLAGSVGSSRTQVETNPTCVSVEPALGIYLYTSNNGNQSISGLQLSPNNGTLKNIQNTPFPTSQLPSCVVAVANGSHAVQVVNN